MVGAAVDDPERCFTSNNYRSAKGLFNHLVSGQQHPCWHGKLSVFALFLRGAAHTFGRNMLDQL
jgi:hypothetical protein